MSRLLTRIVFGSALVAAAATWSLAPVAGQGGGQPSTSRGEWPHYTADVKGTRYSPLDQITAANFNKLEVAWRFKTDSLGPYPEYKLEGTPLMVNGVIYTTGGTRRAVVALEAKSGELIWVHSLREGRRAAVSPRQLSGRGVSYWTDGKGDEDHLRDDWLSSRGPEREDRPADLDAQSSRRQARGGVAAAVVGTRRRLLDRRQGR